MSTPSLQIVAVADGYPKHDYLIRGWEAFLKSSRRYGFEPVILGWGQPWNGLGSKPKLLKKAIEDGTVNAEHILFMDSYDTFFSDDPERILEWFLKQSLHKIVWNAEKNCFPNPEWSKDHPPSLTPFRYLNSGMSVGELSAYLTILDQMKVEEWADDHQLPDGKWLHVNDQEFFLAKFLFGQCGKHEPKMGLDTGCEVFQTYVEVHPDEIEIAKGKILNKTTGTFPIAHHFAGGSKTAGLLEPVLRTLDLW